MYALPDEERLGMAMGFLADTDDEYAEAKANVERSEILRKRARARCFLLADGSVEQRKATTETAADVANADDSYVSAVEVFEKLRAKRERAELVIDVWRSLEASRRKA